MSADLFMTIGVFGVITGVSAFAIARVRASSLRKTWIDEMEAERQADLERTPHS